MSLQTFFGCPILLLGFHTFFFAVLLHTFFGCLILLLGFHTFFFCGVVTYFFGCPILLLGFHTFFFAVSLHTFFGCPILLLGFPTFFFAVSLHTFFGCPILLLGFHTFFLAVSLHTFFGCPIFGYSFNVCTSWITDENDKLLHHINQATTVTLFMDRFRINFSVLGFGLPSGWIDGPFRVGFRCLETVRDSFGGNENSLTSLCFGWLQFDIRRSQRTQ